MAASDCGMSDEYERSITNEDEELKRIREKKLMELMGLKGESKEMTATLVHLTDSNFDEVIAKHPLALIDCWAEWCGPCRAIAPVIEELAKDYGAKALIGKLNVDENPATAARFQIFSIPTLLIVKNGREVDRIVGLVPKRHIESYLDRHLR